MWGKKREAVHDEEEDCPVCGGKLMSTDDPWWSPLCEDHDIEGGA